MRIKYWLLTELACVMWISGTLSVVMGFDPAPPFHGGELAPALVFDKKTRGRINDSPSTGLGALSEPKGYLVHGLDVNAAKVKQARKHIKSLGACPARCRWIRLTASAFHI